MQRVIGRGHVQCLELRRPSAEHVRHRGGEAVAQCAVSDDQDTDHESSPLRTILAEAKGRQCAPARRYVAAWVKASAKLPATSKPVCLVISTNPVGLVTLTSVR